MSNLRKMTFTPDDPDKPVIKPNDNDEETALQKFAKKLFGPSAEHAQATELQKELAKEKVKRGI